MLIHKKPNVLCGVVGAQCCMENPFWGWQTVRVVLLIYHRPVTQVASSKGAERNLNILFLSYTFFFSIGTPTLLCAECVHPSLWGRHPPDWFAHKQGSIITLLYSAALPVRQHKRHIRAAHGGRNIGEKRRGEEREPRRCGVLGLLLLAGRCSVILCLSLIRWTTVEE